MFSMHNNLHNLHKWNESIYHNVLLLGNRKILLTVYAIDKNKNDEYTNWLMINCWWWIVSQHHYQINLLVEHELYHPVSVISRISQRDLLSRQIQNLNNKQSHVLLLNSELISIGLTYSGSQKNLIP